MSLSSADRPHGVVGGADDAAGGDARACASRVTFALDIAAREVRALDALLASADGGGPPVCAALLRAWFSVAWLEAAVDGRAHPSFEAFIASEEGELRRAIVAAASLPPPESWPSREALLSEHRGLAAAWTRVEQRARAHLPPRASAWTRRRAAWATAVGVVLLASAWALLRRPAVWRVVYYRTTRLVDPVASDLSANLGGNWGAAAPHPDVPADGFSDAWETCMVLDASHAFDFVLGSDDGARLIVDGATRIDRWRTQPYSESSTSIRLSAGRHRLRVEHFDSGGVAELALYARIDGRGEPRPLPRSLLRAPASGTEPCR